MKEPPARNVETSLDLQLARDGSGTGWGLSVRDTKSRLLVLQTQISSEQMGQMLGTLLVSTEGTIWQSAYHGKKLEVCSISVPVVYGYNVERWKSELDRVESELEVSHPGWTLKRDEVFNRNHASLGDGDGNYTYTMHLRRWVDDQP